MDDGVSAGYARPLTRPLPPDYLGEKEVGLLDALPIGCQVLVDGGKVGLVVRVMPHARGDGGSGRDERGWGFHLLLLPLLLRAPTVHGGWSVCVRVCGCVRVRVVLLMMERGESQQPLLRAHG